MAAATTFSSSSISSLSTSIIQGLLVTDHFHSSRKLLLHNPLYNSPPLPTPPLSPSSHPQPPRQNNTFDANVVMVLSVLLCALICSLGLNSIIRCALRCSSFVGSDNNNAGAPTLANTGIKKKALKTFPMVSFSADLKIPGLDTECAICLSEFMVGECVRMLPMCHHGFHVRCIDKWLNSHSSCPTCRHCLIETCNKIVGRCSNNSQLPIEEVCVRIEPLRPEGLIRNHQF